MSNLSSADLLAAMANAANKKAKAKAKPQYNKKEWADQCMLALVSWAAEATTEHELNARVELISGQFCSQHLPERKDAYAVGAQALFANKQAKN